MPANYQQNKPAGARPILLVVLLVAALALMTLYAREGDEGPIHTVQDKMLSVIGPFGVVGSHVGAAVESAGQAVQDASASSETLSALREQNEQLRRMVAEAEEYRLEAERLRGLLDMKKVSNVKGKVANVIGSSATAWNQSITIDLGSADGVEVGMTVMGSTGVIGQTTRVDAHSSTVRLLTDPNSGAAVKIQSSRANAIVRGALDGRLHLSDIEGDQIPEVGDVVITSGLGGSYQSGLIVGTIVSVKKTVGNATGDIIVNPNDSASLREEVFVVMDDAALNRAAEAESAAESGQEDDSSAALGEDADQEDAASNTASGASSAGEATE